MKLALIGTANSGKTTLINALEEKEIFKNHNIIHEIAGKFRKSERAIIETQAKILFAQITEESKYVNFISDRSVIDNYAYFMWRYKNAPCKHSYDYLYRDYMSAFNSHMITKPYDQLIFIDEYFPLEDNGIREMDENMQLWIFENCYRAACLYCDIYNIPLVRISGSTETRIERVKEICAPFYKQKRVDDYA